jgi:hypothetical protein
MNFAKLMLRYQAPAGDEGDAGGTAVDEHVDAGTPGADGEAATAAAAAVEAEATKMGWTPKDQFKGDPAKWRPADEFVERGKNMLPIVQATVKRQEKQIEELTRTVKDFTEHMTKTEQRAYDRAMADLKAQRKDAIAAGDGEAFEKVDEAITDLQKEVDAKAAKAKTSAPAAQDDPVYSEWEGRNKWLADERMAEYAEFAANSMRSRGEKAQGAEFLDLVTKKVKEQFPDKFTNPRRESAPSVEGAAPAPRKGGKSYADMPADARAACDRMAKNGFSGDQKAADKFKVDYVKQFFEEA